MKSTTEPSPPADLAQYVRDGLNSQDAAMLREIADYAEDLAAWKEAQAAAAMEEQTEVVEDSDEIDDRPVDVPSKACVVIKTINNNQYYYFQWRDGEKIRSQYKAPIDSSK